MGLWYKEDFNLEGLQSQIAGSFPLSSLLLITFVRRSARRVGSYGIGLLHGLIRSRKEGLGRAVPRTQTVSNTKASFRLCWGLVGD